MKSNLSQRQINILQCILNFSRETGFPPTVRDLQHAEKPKISSTSVVDYNLKALEEHGIIKRGRGRSRAIELIEEKVDELVAKRILRRPPVLVGQRGMMRIRLSASPIAGGAPIPVMEDLQGDSGSESVEMLEVDTRLLGRWANRAEDLFALPVKGQSMIDALIADGDIVIMARQETARDGEAVAVWLKAEQETTLKYFWHEEGDRVRLQPANVTMEPIYTAADNVQIVGRLVSVLRHCD